MIRMRTTGTRTDSSNSTGPCYPWWHVFYFNLHNTNHRSTQLRRSGSAGNCNHPLNYNSSKVRSFTCSIKQQTTAGNRLATIGVRDRVHQRRSDVESTYERKYCRSNCNMYSQKQLVLSCSLSSTPRRFLRIFSTRCTRTYNTIL